MTGMYPASNGLRGAGDAGVAPAPWGGCPRKDPAVHDELLHDGSMVLYHTGHRQVLTLNPTAALVWECCDGAHDPAALAAEVRDVFPDAPAPERDVRALLDQLRAGGMLLAAT